MTSMVKMVIFVFLIVCQIKKYVSETKNQCLDFMADCAKLFPKDHVMQHACRSARNFGQRYGLSSKILNQLIFNDEIYDDVKMRLPSGSLIPYFIYEREPSLFNSMYNQIRIQLVPELTLDQYRQIIVDPDFRIAKAIHATNNQVLLSDMIALMLQHVYEDDVIAIVADLFQGDFKIIAPLIDHFLPELENVTVVKIADNYPKYAWVKGFMKEYNVSFPKVNPSDFGSVLMHNGQEISLEMLRQVLNHIPNSNMATVLPEVKYQQFKKMVIQNELDDGTALPLWLWMRINDVINLNDHLLMYYRKSFIFKSKPEIQNENTTNLITTDAKGKGLSQNNTENFSTPAITTPIYRTNFEISTKDVNLYTWASNDNMTNSNIKLEKVRKGDENTPPIQNITRNTINNTNTVNYMDENLGSTVSNFHNFDYENKEDRSEYVK